MTFLHDSRTAGWLAGIVGLGLLLRLAHLWFLSDTALLLFQEHCTQTDMSAFWQWAQTIVGGDWLGRDTYHPYFAWMKEIAPIETWYVWWGGKETYHQAPFYPYFLAAMLAVKNSPAFALVIQLLIGALQPLVLFFLARRLFDNNTNIALVSAALTALYGPFIFYQAVFLRDWLPPVLEPAILLMVLRAQDQRTAGAWITVGLLMGIGALIKETTLAVSGVVSIWLLLQYRHNWQAAIRPLSLVVLGLVLLLSPLIARNVTVGAPPLAISVQGASNVMLGLTPDMPARQFTVASEQARDIATRGYGRVWDTLKEILHAYGVVGYSKLLVHEAHKVRGLLDPYEIPNNVSYYYGQRISPVLSLTIGYGLVLPLAVTGFVLLLGQWRRRTLLYSYLFASLVVQMVTFTIARFRLSLVPVLILAASFAVIYLVGAIRTRQLGKFTFAAAMVGIVGLVQQLAIPLSVDARRTSDYSCAAIVYAAEGDFARASAEFANVRQRARQGLSGAVLETEAQMHLQWAVSLLAKGHRDAARAQLELGEKIYARIPNLKTPLYNMGLLSANLGAKTQAAEYFCRFLALGLQGPKSDTARRFLATVPQSCGRVPAR